MSKPLPVSQITGPAATAVQRARAGETTEVTSKGRVVAFIVPARAAAPTRPLHEDLRAWRARYPQLDDDPFGDVTALRDTAAPRDVTW